MNCSYKYTKLFDKSPLCLSELTIVKVWLFPLQFHGLWNLLPFVLDRKFQGATVDEPILVGSVGKADDFGGEVFAAVVVNECHFGFGGRKDFRDGDGPDVGALLGTHIAVELAVDFLSRYDNVLFVEVEFQEDFQLVVKEIAFEGAFCLCECSEGSDAEEHAGYENSFHAVRVSLWSKDNEKYGKQQEK